MAINHQADALKLIDTQLAAVLAAPPALALAVFRDKARIIGDLVAAGSIHERAATMRVLDTASAAGLIEHYGPNAIATITAEEFWPEEAQIARSNRARPVTAQAKSVAELPSASLVPAAPAAAAMSTPAPAAVAPVIAASLDGKRLSVRRASDIAARPIAWLWPGRIGIGKLCLIAGVPGVGKSQFAAFLAAAVTGNQPLPCAEGIAPQGSVIILSAEDDESDTIRPRLDAAGADPARVLIVSSVHIDDGNKRKAFNLQADLALLEQQIAAAPDVRLVVIDPISSYLGRVDSHNNTDVRIVLEPLAELAARLRVAVVAITHFSKGSATRAADRVIGSIAFIAAARSAFMIAADPNDAERRLLVPVKNNLAKVSGGLAFRIGERAVGNNIIASRIEWQSDRVTETADDILAANAERTSDRSDAENFLIEMLGRGENPVTDLMAAAEHAGIPFIAVRRAKKKLRVRVFRKPTESGDSARASRWFWAFAPGPRPADATHARADVDGPCG
jgi:hypothetical protein